MSENIFYRDYEIYKEFVWPPWEFAHKEYNGPEDHRVGYGTSIEDCKEQIDERIDEGFDA